MGSGRFDARAYEAYSSTTVGKTTEQVYTSRGMVPELDPKGVKFRESRDSADNPQSTPLIVALDVTGSMGILADVIAREGLGVLFNNVIDRKPITDPHVMFMGIGDANYDTCPLQVSQFEADNRIVDQLTKLYLEHGGGGNAFESYDLAWYFGGFHTVHDAMEKRGRRGYLFTVGDEEFPKHSPSKSQIARFIGDTTEADLTSQDLLQAAQRLYNVFHVVIKEGSHARSHLPAVMGSWTAQMGQHVIPLDDHKKLAEVIVSTIEVAEGVDAEASASRWGGKTAGIVHEAVKNLPRGWKPTGLIGSK